MYAGTQSMQGIYIIDTIVAAAAVEIAKQGVTAGEEMVSGLTFAGDFVGISERPEGLRKQLREKTLDIIKEHNRK